METASKYCDVCQKQFTSWANYEEHNNSPAHRKAIDNQRQIIDKAKSLKNPPSSIEEIDLETLDEFMITQDKNLYYCKLCQVPCSGKIPALNHCLGKSHRKQKQRHEFSMAPAGQSLNTGSVLRSSNSVSNTSASLGMIEANTSSPHVPSSTNGIMNSATSSDLPYDLSVFETNPLTGHLFCNVCKLSVSGVVPAQQHVQGKAHIKKAKRVNAFQSLQNEMSGTVTDLESQFSCLNVSNSTYKTGNVLEKEGILVENEKDATLQENMLSSSLNKLHDNLSTRGNEATSAHSVDGGKEVKIHEDEDDVELDKATGHWKCKVCQVQLTGEEPMKQHIVGKAHQKKKKAAAFDRGSSYLPLITNDFTTPSHPTLPVSPHEIKGGITKEMENVVPQSPYHAQSRAASEPPRNSSTSLLGPKVSPYLVQQQTGKDDDAASTYSDQVEAQDAKDALAKGNLELARQLSTPLHHGAEMDTPYDHNGVRSNPPMADFLQHQRTAAMRPDMGRFWSMQSNSTAFLSPSSPHASGDTTGTNASKTVDPIGTQPRTKSSEQGIIPKMQGQDPIKQFFTVERSSGKLLCRVCDVSVSGSEPAHQHLQGKSHQKKQRAYEFNQNHMMPFMSSLATPQGHGSDHQLGHQGPPGPGVMGVSSQQDGFPPNTSQQRMTSTSPPQQQQVHPQYAAKMDSRHQRNPYYNPQAQHPPLHHQGDFIRGTHPEQYRNKPPSMGHHPSHPPSSQNQGLHHSPRSPPPPQQVPSPYQGAVSQSLLHVGNESFLSSISHHSRNLVHSDDKAHSLRGVSLAENWD